MQEIDPPTTMKSEESRIDIILNGVLNSEIQSPKSEIDSLEQSAQNIDEKGTSALDLRTGIAKKRRIAETSEEPSCSKNKLMKRRPTDQELALNLFIKKLAMELLDRRLTIVQQPRHRLALLESACQRQFPEFSDRQIRLKVRGQLKLYRRNLKKAEERHTANMIASSTLPVKNHQKLFTAYEVGSLRHQEVRPKPMLFYSGHGSSQNVIPSSETHSARNPTALRLTENALTQERNHTIPNQLNQYQCSSISNNHAPSTTVEVLNLAHIQPSEIMEKFVTNSFSSNSTNFHFQSAAEALMGFHNNLPTLMSTSIASPMFFNEDKAPAKITNSLAIPNVSELIDENRLCTESRNHNSFMEFGTPTDTTLFAYKENGVMNQSVASTTTEGGDESFTDNSQLNQTWPNLDPSSHIIASCLRLTANFLLQSASVFEIKPIPHSGHSENPSCTPLTNQKPITFQYRQSGSSLSNVPIHHWYDNKDPSFRWENFDGRKHKIPRVSSA